METRLKKLLPLSLIALIALPMSAIGENERLDNYDKTSGILWWQTWPPWIPGTEGQKEVKIQVLDAATMEPIEGAIVVGGYYGSGNRRGAGGVVCAVSESAVSDAEGWATFPNDQDPRVGGGVSPLRGPRPESAYKRGYQGAITIYVAVAGGHNEWYVREYKPAPRGVYSYQWEIVSSRRFSDDHRSVLMETKERSRIYMMPSTATTEEERSKELNLMDSGKCSYTMPFEFSESEGGLAFDKAVYQEMLNAGMEHLRYRKDRADSYERSYLEFRQRTAKQRTATEESR